MTQKELTEKRNAAVAKFGNKMVVVIRETIKGVSVYHVCGEDLRNVGINANVANLNHFYAITAKGLDNVTAKAMETATQINYLYH